MDESIGTADVKDTALHSFLTRNQEGELQRNRHPGLDLVPRRGQIEIRNRRCRSRPGLCLTGFDVQLAEPKRHSAIALTHQRKNLSERSQSRIVGDAKGSRLQTLARKHVDKGVAE